MATAAKCPLDTSYFFQQVALADKRFLILDFDSILARYSEPAARFPYPRVPDLLECIAASARTRLILVSAAPPDELVHALPCPDFEIWACDGQQRIVPAVPGGKTERVSLSVRSRAGVDCRRNLINKRSSRYPVAYLVGAAENVANRAENLLVVPELRLPDMRRGNGQVLTAMPEPLVQFLADWLHASAGEIC